VRHADEVRQRRVAPRLGDDAMARVSAVDAAVTMLRVYCAWPGASAMMNLRRGVAK